MRILGFGDNIIDRFLDRATDYPGGNAVNVAVYARRLGADSAYLGVFGDDDLGAFLREAIEAAGVPTEQSLVKPGESGFCHLQVRNGDRTFLSSALGDNGGGVTVRDPIDLADGRLEYAETFDLVHSSVYSATEPELPRLRAGSTLVSFDFSEEAEFRSPDYLDRVVPAIDLALFSCSEQTPQETRDLLADAARRGAVIALATRGTEGAIVTDGEHWASTPARLIEDPGSIVDTMGCGDAFVTGFVFSLLGGGWSRNAPPGAEALADALHAGADAAREQCFVEGAFGLGRPTPLPTA